MQDRGRIALAEGIGTMILVVGGPGTAILATGSFAGPRSTVGVLGVALAFGLSLLCAAYAIGSISGCHINPAVTIGLWAIKKTETALVPFYLVGQVVGGIVGAAIIFVIANSIKGFSAEASGFASNGYGSHSPGGFGLGAVILAEIVFTAIFVFVIASTSRGSMTVGFTGPHRRPHAHPGPPDHDPDRQHLGEPGPEPRDRGLPGLLGARAALGVHRVPDRRRPSAPSSGGPWSPRTTGSAPSCGRGVRIRVVKGPNRADERSAHPIGSRGARPQC